MTASGWEKPLAARADLTAPPELVLMRKWGEFTDFYSSEHHARNVGKIFRDPENALLPNWKHLPVGYHGRSSSIIASGNPVYRPSGQRKEPDGSITFGPTRKLDFELEVGVVISRDSERGRTITMAEADSYIEGLVLVNDWSARDIQAWEYVPLGPFLGKNFATTVGDTAVPLASLEPYRIEGPEQDPKPLPYLQRIGPSHFDITLEAWHETSKGVRTLLTRTNHKHLYWDIRQQLVHHTSNGCNVRAGDILASGTISGPERESWGCLLELSWNGTEPLTLEDDTQRTFLEDGDIVEIRGWSGEGKQVELGSIRNPILPGLAS